MEEPQKSVKQLRAVSGRQLSYLVTALGVLFVGFGLSGVWAWYRSGHQHDPAKAAHPLQTVTHSTSHPDETPITSGYTVAANQPWQISIPTIHARGFIQKVSIDQHHAIGVPSNINLAGWFTGSPLPGQPGVSIIDGHVQGFYNPGIFKHLADTKPGDNVGVEFGDRTWRRFSVVSVQSLPASKVSSAQYAAEPGVQKQLTLITCGGPYDSASHEYTNRVLVRARLISS